MPATYKTYRANKRMHTHIAEQALGRPLPKGAEIHHVDGDGHNYHGTNLVICPNHAYHAMLHRRERALASCGHADWVKCRICGCYDDPSSMQSCQRANGEVLAYHGPCNVAAVRQWRERKKVTEPGGAQSRHAGAGDTIQG